MVGFVALALGSVPVRSQDERPDIVFVIVDDLNDWLGCLGGHPAAVSPHRSSAVVTSEAKAAEKITTP